MYSYLQIVEDVLSRGKPREDRTGTGTLSLRSHRFIHDMSLGFPLLTTKTVSINNVLAELLWFLRGSSNVEELRELTYGPDSDKKTIWDANYENQAKSLGYTNGELGPIYGKQWRSFSAHDIGDNGTLVQDIQDSVDQIKEVLALAKKDPTSRRLLVSAWNPLDLDISALPPCHMLIKLYIEDGKLDLIWSQRSTDVFLGLPYNIASYAALLLIFAKLLNLEPGMLEGELTNVHIYSNHITQMREQARRKPYKLPKLKLPEFSTLEEVEKLTPKYFTLENYVHHPAIKGDMAV